MAGEGRSTCCAVTGSFLHIPTAKLETDTLIERFYDHVHTSRNVACKSTIAVFATRLSMFHFVK